MTQFVKRPAEQLMELTESDSLEVTGQAGLRMTAPKGHGHLLIIEMQGMDERYRG